MKAVRTLLYQPELSALAGSVGFEPTTYGLTGEVTAIYTTARLIIKAGELI